MIAQEEQVIRDFYGKIIGKVYTFANGDKQARDFYGRCVGKYFKDRNVTTDFYGRVVAKGDTVVSMLYTSKG